MYEQSHQLYIHNQIIRDIIDSIIVDGENVSESLLNKTMKDKDLQIIFSEIELVMSRHSQMHIHPELEELLSLLKKVKEDAEFENDVAY
jgi:hypothetical protein